MRTESLSIANYCAPCRCRCRHCLLAAGPHAAGVDYARGERLAERFARWARNKRPELQPMYYAGYCMDFPQIDRLIRFNGNSFLQCNGMGMMDAVQAAAWFERVWQAGARLMDCTFYGTRETHDRFAGRPGDFDFLFLLMDAARAAGLQAQASVALTRENAGEMAQLYACLEAHGVERIYSFFCHSKGRGAALAAQRLTRAEFDALPARVQGSFSSFPHDTEAGWIARGVYPQAVARNITLVLTPENIERLESAPPEESIARLEEMDENFYAEMGGPERLAQLVGQPDNQQIFRFRDLYLEWQKRYIRRFAPGIYDMNDERHSFSVRRYLEKGEQK